MSDPWKSFGPDRGLGPYASKITELETELAQVKAELATARATISENDKLRHKETDDA